MVKLVFEEKTGRWLELPDLINRINLPDPWVLVIDGRLIPVLNAVKKRLRSDQDAAAIISGNVGDGKSNLGRVCGRYVSNEKFHPKEHVIKNITDIGPVFTKAKRGDAILFDEGSLIFSSTDSLNKNTKYASKVLDVCRQRNLFLIIAAPRFHRLKSDLAIDRTQFFLRAYRNKKSNSAGPFAFYGGNLKERLYYHLKKYQGSFKGIRPKWRGTVGKEFTYPEEYQQQKDDTFRELIEEAPVNKQKVHPRDIKRDVEWKIVKNNATLPNKQLAEILGCSVRKIENVKSKLRQLESYLYVKPGGVPPIPL